MSSQWKLVPVEPTETMVINGFESEPDECFTDEEVWEQYQAMSGCQQAAFRAKLCWAAMLDSAPAAPQAELDPAVAERDATPKPDQVLCKFYGVDDWASLVRELFDHVAQLQESAKRNVKPWEDTFPPTLLPSYIERVNAANAAAQPQDVPVEWGAPKTVRQLIRQLETLDQDLRPLSMLRVPASVFEDGKERVRATHLSFSHERVDGQWLAPFKSDGEKVLAFWCRMEQPAPITVAHPFAEKVISKLERFQECADDGQGADIGRHWFDLLTQLGLLNRVQRSPALWEMTQQGEHALELSRQGAKSRQEYIRTPAAKPVTPPPSKSAAIVARTGIAQWKLQTL